MWWTWFCIGSGSWQWTGKPGVLQSMGSRRVRHNWATELSWTATSWQRKVPQSRVTFTSQLEVFLSVLLRSYLWKHKPLHLPLSHMQCQVEFFCLLMILFWSQKKKKKEGKKDNKKKKLSEKWAHSKNRISCLPQKKYHFLCCLSYAKMSCMLLFQVELSIAFPFSQEPVATHILILSCCHGNNEVQ